MQELRAVKRLVKPSSYKPPDTTEAPRNEFLIAYRASNRNKLAYRLLLEDSACDNAYYEQLIGGRRRILETITDKEVYDQSGIDAKLLQERAFTHWNRLVAFRVKNSIKRKANVRHKLAQRLEACGAHTEKRICPKGRVTTRRWYCGEHRYCIRCAQRESYVEYANLSRLFDVIMDNWRTGYGFYLLTVTKRVTHRIGLDMKSINQGFSELWKEFKKDPHSAAMRFSEIGTGDNCHAHILLYAKFKDIERLRSKWLEITGDSNQIHIKPIATGHKRPSQRRVNKAVREVTKYCVDHGKYIEKVGIDQAVERAEKVTRTMSAHRIRRKEAYGLFRRDVFKRRIGTPPAKFIIEADKETCRCCGLPWAKVIDIFEPRPPPNV